MKLTRWTATTWATATVGLVAASCAEAEHDSQLAEVATAAEALCDAGSDAQHCSTGQWPEGKIYYQFVGADAAYQASVRAGMDRWEQRTNGVIRFIADSTRVARAKIQPGSSSPGYDGCVNGCVAGVPADLPDHELGHLIGLFHNHQRYDRNHYVQVNYPQCTAYPIDWTKCNSPDAKGDFGPFDYRSVMGYAPTHPDIARWDGAPICPGYGTVGQVCPRTSAGPNGNATRLDGAAVVELYRISESWQKFRRTDTEDKSSTGLVTPYPSSISGSVRVAGSPAVVTTTTAESSIRVFARGSDNMLYEKSCLFPTIPGLWSTWMVHPNGTFSSDPAAVYDGVQTHLAALGMGGTEVWMQSWASGMPGGYANLGGPSVGPRSAPAMTSWGQGRLDVFVRGSDNRLYWRRCSTSGTNCSPSSGNWNSWTLVSTTAQFLGKPAAISGRVPGVIDVFVHGMDHKLWGVQYANGAWGSFYNAGLPGTLGWYDSSVASGSCATDDCYSPAITGWSGGLDIIIRGSDSQAWSASYANGASWVGYRALGGVLTSSPALPTRARSSRAIDLVVTMDEERAANTFVPTMWWKHFPKP